MKKLLFFLLLMTAVVGRAQTSLDLLPVGTEAPDFTITDSKTGKKIFQLSDKKTQKDKDGRDGSRCSGPCSISGLPGVQTAEETCRW
ncbi:MAG: hypothetical protein ACLRYB_13310 [Segatella copri]